MLYILTLVSLLAACGGEQQVRVQQQVDSLNLLAYANHYRSLDTTEQQARQALHLSLMSHSYPDGRDEACCNIAFAFAMRQEYDSAKVYYEQVSQQSNNQLLRLLADVGMMRVCQRMSANKEFYHYRNSAARAIERVSPEQPLMTPHQQQLWNYAVSDYHLTLSTYYYYLRQEDEANEEIRYVAQHPELVEADSAQLAYFLFLGGNTRNVDNQLPEDDMQHILRCIAISHAHGYSYWQSKAFTTLAQDLVHATVMRASRLVYVRELINMSDSIANDQVPLYLGLHALEAFQHYGSPFDIAQTYIMLADYYMHAGEADRALEMMDLAVQTEQVRGNVPELKVDVHEQLSLVFSALDMIPEANQQRNNYLDILDSIRRDRRFEQSIDMLKAEEETLNRTMLLAGGIIVLLILLLLYLSRRIRSSYASNYHREQKQVEAEMAMWRQRSDEDFSNLEEHQEDVESERYVNEVRLHDQKRQYIDKMTCLSLVYAITPFLDRAVNEVRKVQETDSQPSQLRQSRLEYLSELVERINLYNDILSHWIKVRQGTVSLHIGNFALQPLFDILGKSSNVFVNNGIALTVSPTDAVVKADQALTLFMMNTLLDNARKFTPEGGRVALSAAETDQYVEISVADTGCGLSEEDVNRILSEKVYDSSKIGTQTADATLLRSKGSGFGLMNCKGIIEKYRKTNPIFSVCTFSIESRLGQGSRFFFRLPKGVIRTFILAVCFLTLSFTVSHASQPRERHPYLERASAFADSVYFANVDGDHSRALCYVDSACHYLNAYYLLHHPDGPHLLHRTEVNSLPDIELWKDSFDTDYHIILDIRNEAAIAALALKQWDVYYYNNEVYTRLYKLIWQDKTLEQYYREAKKANTNRRAVFIFLIALFVLLTVIYLLIYYRNNILTTFNMRQILELNRRIFTRTDEQHLAQIIEDGLNDIRRTDGVGVLSLEGVTQFSARCPRREQLTEMMKRCISTRQPVFDEENILRVYPLQVDERQDPIGALAIVLHNADVYKHDAELFSMIARYTAINIYYSTVRMERLRVDIELEEDEKRRAEREANKVHVQNMILDNCLSTIKHETMYYPSRILQLLHESQPESIDTIHQLITYYKEVFTLLSACAAHEITNPCFRRHTVTLEQEAEEIRRVFERLTRKSAPALRLHISPLPKDLVLSQPVLSLSKGSKDMSVALVCDDTMLHYLYEQVISAFIDMKKDGNLTINFAKSEEFCKFAFEFDAADFTDEQRHNMFYPESLHYDPQEDKLLGAQWLIAKQIIREHDAHLRRGCRIYSEPLGSDGHGIRIVFTMLMKN